MATVLLLLALLLAISLLLVKPWSKKANLPPGPTPWPVVGNLVHLQLLLRRRRPRRGEKNQLQPHEAFATLARAHGPLLHLRMGARHLVVASSPAAAAEVLRTHDRVLSCRHVPATYRVPSYTDHSIVFSVRCNDRWKSLRALCRAELSSPRSLDGFASLRERKAREMVDFLSREEGREVKIGELAFTTVFNMLGNMFFSRDVLVDGGGEEGGDERGWFRDLKRQMGRILELGLVPNLEDFYPAVLGGWDLQGLRREVRVYLEKVDQTWDCLIGKRREEMGGGDGKEENLLEVLLRSGLADVQLKAFFMDIFTAGTDTTTSLIEWTLSELVRNPRVMAKVRDELEHVVGQQNDGEEDDDDDNNNKKNRVRDTHLPNLSYLHACIKESLRLHPPAPLLLPHLALEPCERVMDRYTVPKDSIVMVNVWAIGRDPDVWPDPLTFSPERFLDSSVDYKGVDFQFVPFGAGRRICPGLQMATRLVQLVLASMLHSFDWSLPDGIEPSELNMDEKLGLVLERKHPLVLIPKSTTGHVMG